MARHSRPTCGGKYFGCEAVAVRWRWRSRSSHHRQHCWCFAPRRRTVDMGCHACSRASVVCADSCFAPRLPPSPTASSRIPCSNESGSIEHSCRSDRACDGVLVRPAARVCARIRLAAMWRTPRHSVARSVGRCMLEHSTRRVGSSAQCCGGWSCGASAHRRTFGRCTGDASATAVLGVASEPFLRRGLSGA
jgi:hypothetical protein